VRVAGGGYGSDEGVGEGGTGVFVGVGVATEIRPQVAVKVGVGVDPSAWVKASLSPLIVSVMTTVSAHKLLGSAGMLVIVAPNIRSAITRPDAIIAFLLIILLLPPQKPQRMPVVAPNHPHGAFCGISDCTYIRLA